MGNAAIVLRGGSVIDGTGAPQARGDVRIEGDRIVGIGDVDLDDATVIDAGGLCVSPGFIDPHTHYDAQILWDPDLTPSSWHGVTSVVMGNCGFGVAPTRAEHRGIIARTLENVEGMALEALEAGIRWEFETFPEYLDTLGRSPVRTNYGAMIGHTPLRLYVMGTEASERAATDEEISRMCAIAGDAIDAGALGIATSRALGHVGAYGRPVPSRLADPAEIDALAGVLAEKGRGTFQLVRGPDFETADQFARLAEISGRPVTWIPLFADGTALAKLRAQEALGGEVWPQMACRPIVTQLRLLNPLMFGMLPSFKPIMEREAAHRAELYRDLSWRAGAEIEANARWSATWEHIRVKESVVHRDLIDGPNLVELAAQRESTPFDVMIELSLEEDLRTRFEVRAANVDEAEIAELLVEDGAFLGLSDAGAHARELCDAGYATHLLGSWSRDRGVIDLETAVWRVTAHPANVFRIVDRGVLRPGAFGDVVAFDPETVANRSNIRVHDLPGGADRLISQSAGIEHVVINGTVTRRAGVDVAGVRPGRMLEAHA